MSGTSATVALRPRGSAVLGLVLALALAPGVSAAESAPTASSAPTTCAPPLRATSTDRAPAASPAPTASASLAPGPAGPDLSRGRWVSMARAPFGSEYEPIAWTGRRLIAFDPDSGRTAKYDPRRDRWREVARGPRLFDSTARSAWTGRELVIVQPSADGRSVVGAAYEPLGDRWRTTATLAWEGDGPHDDALTQPLWTGSHLIVASSLGQLAAYDPAADCWAELGRVPGEPWVWGLYRAGPALLVESRRPAAPVELRALDLATMSWSGPFVGPLDPQAAREGGAVWVDGRLVYLSWYPPDEDAGAANATFDPASSTWATFAHDCTTAASATLAVEGALLASNGRRALDGRTLACLELPPAPRRLNGTERLTWTGRELIAWSGIRSLPEGPRRGGLVYRPTDTQQG